MGWGNIYKRRVKVFTVALIIYFDYKALQQREKWANKSKKASLWEKAHERNAKRVLNLIVELEGLWVKLGQYLSTRADVLPEAYTCLLKQLQDSLPPRSLKEVCRTIEKEFGKTMDDLFLDFDNVPLATASIAQVHHATLSDGQEVVVKVQHDGIKAVILEDLKNAKSIVDWVAWAEPQYNFHPMIDEWCKEAPKELDFNHEAENTRKVSRNLCCNKRCDDSKPTNHVDVLIPEVIQSTEMVLILEYMDGVRLNDTESLRALGVDKQKLVEEITRAYAHQIYVDGFFNGDPHPGNFLVSKEPPHRPILLDFGLTKLLSSSLKQALAKMFLAAAEGDHVALLSAFAEMGLKFRLDVPEQAMEVTSVFFRSSTPANEALESMKMLSEQRSKNLKVIQEKMKLNEKEVKRFNPVDAFPSDIVIFGRVLNLLRGLSATMNVRIVYIDIMRPFAEYALQCNLNRGPSLNPRWIYDTPVHSDVEAKLRQLLVELGNAEKILGIQVCAYKDGEVIIDTAAGVLGKYDPRPVQPDSLFSVFSVTKGISAGLVHWLVDNGKLKLEDNIANIWPEFASHGKDQIKVHHVLNHTSGLHNAMGGISQEDPFLMTDWDECLKRIAMTAAETAPGHEQLYHYLSFGWLCGGIIERASGRRFQELLEEVFVRPLKIDGELYVGIPPGVESRLATLTVDMSDLTKLSNVSNHSDLPSTFQPQQIAQLATTLPAIFNSLYARRAIIPAANGHCSARALARYYAALAEGGRVPPPHYSSMPTLGSHPHIPKFPSQQTVKKQKSRKKTAASDADGPGPTQNSSSSVDNGYGNDGKGNVYVRIPDDNSCSGGDTSSDNRNIKLFHNQRVHDAFMGVGEYENLTDPNGEFGLGFKRSYSTSGELIGFGHSGMGGSTGFCNLKHKFAIAVTLNKLSFGSVTAKIIHLICSELNIPVPQEISRLVETGSSLFVFCSLFEKVVLVIVSINNVIGSNIGEGRTRGSIIPAMDAVIRVFKRVSGLEADGNLPGAAGAAFCSIRLLVASTQAVNLIGKQGSLIKPIQQTTGASIRVLSNDEMPIYATSDERVVEIQGEALKVLKALEAVIGHLRKFLVDHSVLPLFEKSYNTPATQTQEREPEPWSERAMLNTSRPGLGMDYPPPTKRDSLFSERESQLDSQYHPPGLSLYGQDPGLSANRTSGLGRAGNPVITQISQTVQMQIPLAYAEDIIGIGGANIAYIRRTSGAILTVQESRGLPDEITVEIKGTSSEVQTAQQLIQEFMGSHKESLPSSYGQLDTGLRQSSYSNLGSGSYSSSSYGGQQYGGGGSYGSFGAGGYSSYRS